VTFEVGQKVEHLSHGEVEVTYGPFRGRYTPTAYLLKLEDGRETVGSASQLTAIPEAPKFAVGDVVSLATRAGAKATVEYGPFDDGDVYVVKLVDAPAYVDDPRTFTAMAHVMTKVDEPEPVKVGDRVRVVAASYAESVHGQIGSVTAVGDLRTYDGIPHRYAVSVDGMKIYASEVERVEDENTYTHDGVTYDLSATYNDRDDEPWTFERFGGEVRGGCNGFTPSPMSETLEGVVSLYGPLTRI
jgi:hypothetical protein